MSKLLYDEAIAEAKLLQETAEQNAKNAIIEAVTPKIREFIEEQLLRESSSASDDDILESVAADVLGTDDNDVILDESALSSLLEIFGGDDIRSAKKSDKIAYKSALEEAFDSLNAKNRRKLVQVANKVRHSADFLHERNIDIDDKTQQENLSMSRDEILYEVDLDDLDNLLSERCAPPATEGGKKGDRSHRRDYEDLDEERGGKKGDRSHAIDFSENLDEDDELDLDEIMSLLGDDLLSEDVLEIDLGDLAVEDELQDALSRASISVRQSEEDEEVDVDELEDAEAPDDAEVEVGFEEEFEEESLDEVFEIDENLLRSELRRLYRSGALEEAKDLVKLKGIKNDMAASWGGKGDGKAGVKGAYGGTGTGKTGPVGAFGGGKSSGEPLKVKLNKLSEALLKERRSNRSLKGRLGEYRSAVETLREQLTDLNLFNAKLLYVNKLLQDKTTTPSRKRSIVEAIDKAKTLREVKLLYRSLTQLESGRLNEHTSRRVMGSSSRPTGRSSSSTSATAEVDRWSVLAGLK